MEHRLEFTLSENPWAPTAVIDEINLRTGAGLILTGLSGQVGGVSSAAFVQWPDRRDAALTRTKTPLARMHQTATVLNAARAGGLPVPRHDLVLPLSDGLVAVVQERLPGTPPDQASIRMVDAMVELNERFQDLLAYAPDVPPPDAFPTTEATWNETLGRHSDRSRRVLERMREIEGPALFQMSGNDLVHVDYSLENALFDESGNLTGIVDWNFGIARGDRRFSLLRLKSNVASDYGASPDVIAHVNRILEMTLGPDLLRTYSRHVAVQKAHYAIRNRFKGEGKWGLEHSLREAESTVGLL